MLAASRARLSALFVEREVFLRTGGQVRFLRITRRAQMLVAGLVAGALAIWAVVTAGMLAFQVGGAVDRAALAHERAAVARQAAEVAGYRASSGNVAADLVRRQAVIEQLVETRLGRPAATPAPQPSQKISALPDRATLAALGARQDAFAAKLAASFDARSQVAAATLDRLGLNSAKLLADSKRAQGGPLIPLGGAAAMTPALIQLARSVERWSLLQDNLVALPSGPPTAGTPVTSSYGVRSDPFTGAPAFHAGLDFIGAYGQPIRAAAPGRVVFVGQRSGYGNVVEIDHGHGLLTRYAHLSGFAVKPGQAVARGAGIARMGSTGRSTGTHLHFEVRVDGNPVNPRRFLTAPQEIADVH